MRRSPPCVRCWPSPAASSSPCPRPTARAAGGTRLGRTAARPGGASGHGRGVPAHHAGFLAEEKAALGEWFRAGVRMRLHGGTDPGLCRRGGRGAVQRGGGDMGSVTIGVDVGQRVDPTAIAVCRARRRSLHRALLERLPLGTSYPEVAVRVGGSTATRWRARAGARASGGVGNACCPATHMTRGPNGRCGCSSTRPAWAARGRPYPRAAALRRAADGRVLHERRSLHGQAARQGGQCRQGVPGEPAAGLIQSSASPCRRRPRRAPWPASLSTTRSAYRRART